jgi:hypothetical protein
VARKFTIDVNQRLVVSTFYGEVSDADLGEIASLIRSHPDFEPSFSEIIDVSGITAGTFSTSALANLSRQASIFNLTSLHAIIAPQTHLFGLARMAQVLAEKTKPNLVVVKTMDEARKFLKLDKTG